MRQLKIIFLVFILSSCVYQNKFELDSDIQDSTINDGVDQLNDQDGNDNSGEDDDQNSGEGDNSQIDLAGEISLNLTADVSSASNAIVSTGVPFAPGVLFDIQKIKVLDNQNSEISIQVQELARWPMDNSIRSVLILFRKTLSYQASQAYKVTYGSDRSTVDLAGLAPNPDGPISALLPASWYVQSRVSGFLGAQNGNVDFAAYDSEVYTQLFSMDPPFTDYNVSCGSTSYHRTYYDSVHGIYHTFLRRSETRLFRRARVEAKFFRDNELVFVSGRSMAVQVCQGDATNWNPSIAIGWSVLRRMTAQGMLDDYLLTGDPEAKEAVLAMGEAFRQNIPALIGGSEDVLLVTERNMAWTILGLVNYYALDNRQVVKQALEQLVNRAIDWQNAGTSGAFEHDINRPDPGECSYGPNGASPFMTSILVEALMDSYFLLEDIRLKEVILKVANWYHSQARTSSGRTFKYLWGCETDSYDSWNGADLNFLMVHVYGAAYYLSEDRTWITRGDVLVNYGLEDIYVKRPKQWTQSTRTFGLYLGYRNMSF